MIKFEKTWRYRFRIRKPEVLTKARAASLSVLTLDELFNLLLQVYSEKVLLGAEDASEDLLYNCEETGCNTDPTTKKMFFKKSRRESYIMTTNCGKTMYTGLFAGSAGWGIFSET